jgi:NAD(P)-dependent dehydrogenase (short-subunit alcohol dehydrogenase family)
MKFKGEVAIVTGGGTGIGREIARLLAREGASVAVCGRTAATLEETATLAATGGKARAFPCDVTRPEPVARLVQQVEESFGPVSILVNNAGIARFAPLWQLSVEDFDAMMDVNVKGAFLCSRAVIPGMIERKRGRILNVASVAGVRPYPNQGGYVASKHAILGLSKVMALELQPHGIQVQTLSPGGVDTALSRGSRNDVDFSDWMRPEEVAEAALFLLSQEGIAVTDHLILRRRKATAWSNASG